MGENRPSARGGPLPYAFLPRVRFRNHINHHLMLRGQNADAPRSLMFPEILLPNPSTPRRLTDTRKAQDGDFLVIGMGAGGSGRGLGWIHSDGVAVSADSI